jgi:hypothetical protein
MKVFRRVRLLLAPATACCTEDCSQRDDANWMKDTLAGACVGHNPSAELVEARHCRTHSPFDRLRAAVLAFNQDCGACFKPGPEEH